LFPDEQLTLRAAPNLRSIGILTAHIIAARVVWFHAVMGEGPADLMPMRNWDDYDPIQQNAAELVAELEATRNGALVVCQTRASIPRISSPPLQCRLAAA
jgi:hypothetical protein